MRSLAFLATCVAFALGTLWLGWWAVPAASILAAFATRLRPFLVALAAGLAWSGFLLLDAVRGAPVLRLADRLSGVFGVPVAAVLAASPLFALLLAWSAASGVRLLRGER